MSRPIQPFLPPRFWLAFLLASVLPLAGPACPAAAQQNLIGNGGFENGTEGWMWEQWDGKPLPGAVDKTERADGEASFRMGIGGGGARWLAKEAAIQHPGKDHVLSFALKLKDVPAGACRVRLGIEGRGFLNGGDLVRLGGTRDWQTYRFAVPGSSVGDAKRATLFFYHDRVDRGFVWIDSVSLREGTLTPEEAASGSGGKLTCETNRPDLSTFPLRQPVKLAFSAEGLRPRAANLSLILTIVDEHGKTVQSRALDVKPDAQGRWSTVVEGPSSRLGFYRVLGRLSNGVELKGEGTRPDGFITYAVVPDPAARPRLPEDRSRFGLQGAPPGGDQCTLLGVRWTLDGGLAWKATEPARAGQFAGDAIRGYVEAPKQPSQPYEVYALPTLFEAPDWPVKPETHIYETGTLTPDGEGAWTQYCGTAARAFRARFPGRKRHVYQITWEPVQPWGFKGTDADLIRIYQIAYAALHAADPNAVVAGPCRGIWNNGDPDATEHLFKLGLGKYLDAYIAHPYETITPEQDGMPQAIRAIKRIIRTSTGRELPMYGSEQGWPTDEDTSKEILQAQGLLRQNLITLGEGFAFNFGFYLYDYRMEGSKTGYGYYYNLDRGVPFGPKRLMPKPIAPAWAAQSMILDGCDSAGAIEWLGAQTWGYAFERPGYRALALWSYGDKPRVVTLPTAASSVRVFDWMGNGRTVATSRGDLRLTLGPEPVYVTGVSPSLWGRAAAKSLTLTRPVLRVHPGSRISLAGAARLSVFAGQRATVAVESAWGGTSPSAPVRIRNGASPFRLTLPVPASAPAGTFRPRVVMRNSQGVTLAQTSVELIVEPPVAVRIRPLIRGSHRPSVEITVAGAAADVAGSLSFRLDELAPEAVRPDLPLIDLALSPGQSTPVPGAAKTERFSLHAGGTRNIVVPIDPAVLSGARTYRARISLTTSSGWRSNYSERVTFLSAPRSAHSIRVDGDLSDWPEGAAIELKAPRDVIRNPSLVPPDFTASLRYCWDERALYVAAEVHDDRFVQPFAAGDIWRGDCIQLAFDLDRDPAKRESAERRTSEITVALTPNGPEAYRHGSFAADKLPLGSLKPPQASLAIVRQGAGTIVYELAIPWASLGMETGRAPRAGDTIGVGATVNEIRTPDQKDPGALGFFGGIYPDKNHDRTGVMTLVR